MPGLKIFLFLAQKKTISFVHKKIFIPSLKLFCNQPKILGLAHA